MAKIISFSIVILVGFMVCCPVAVLHEADAAETQGQSAAGTIVSSFSVAFQTVEPQGIEFLNNYLYISRGEDPYRKIYQYDTQGNLVQVISTSNGCPRELAWDGAYFWHPDTCFHRILKIDGLGNTIQSFASPYASPCAIAWDGTDLWLSFAGQGNKIFRMDTSGNLTGDSITTPTADYPSGLVFVGGYFWVSGYTDEKIYQVDMAGNILSLFDAPGTQPAGLAFDGKYLWHTDIGTDRVYQIEIYTGPPFIVTDRDTVMVPEGSTATFKVKISEPPSSFLNVSVQVIGGDTDIAVQSGSNLTFTPSNWNTYRTVTLVAADGDDPKGRATIRISAEGISDKEIMAIEADNDLTCIPGVVTTLPIASGILPYVGQGFEHDGNHLWLPTVHPDSKVYKIDPFTGSIVDSYGQDHYQPGISNVHALAFDRSRGYLYNYVYPYGPFYLVDTLTLQQIPNSSFAAPANWIHDIALDPLNQVLWVMTGDSIGSNYRIYKLNSSNGSVEGSFTSPANAANPIGLAWDGTNLWVSESSSQSLYRVNPGQALIDGNCDNSVLSLYRLPEMNLPVARLAWDGRYLWTMSTTQGLFYKIDPCSPLTGSLQVTISPEGAIDAGARWRIDGGVWQVSGYTQSVPVGEHTLEFSDLSGWVKPGNQVMTISGGQMINLSGTYTPQETGSLQVTISPQEAIDAGAKWRVDEGAWHDSGYIQQLPVGQHTVDFNDAWGCIKANNRTVTISNGQTTHVTEIYLDCTPGALMVNISPQVAIDAGAQWRRVGTTTWLESGMVETGIPCDSEVVIEFSDIAGWRKPSNQTVPISIGGTTRVTGTYYGCTLGALMVNIYPQEAIDAGAKWRVDGGAWHDSGYIQQLPVGQHSVDFNNARGCMKPNNRTVTISNGQTTHVTGTYLDCTPGALMVNIYPQAAIDAGARWRRVGTSTWLDSGVLETMIPLGQHTVEFSDVPGWVKPTNQWVTATFGQTATASGTYVLCSASLIVTISPQEVINAGAKWRRVGTGTWLDSGYTETGIPCGGERTVEFNDIPGWMKPPNQSVTISDGQTATVVGNFDAKPVSFPFFDDFSTDQGWSGYELGGWERGPVLKGHAERGYSDPALDHSLNEDNFVLGFAIGGNYPNGISETKWIISPPIDCTGQEQVFLKFWRYLDVQGNKVDHAAIYVSKDGTEFYRVWENPRSFVCDSHWVRKVYDISAIAANQATVYIAFGMGPTNSSGQFSGWNIDDVEVTSWYSISGFVRDRAGTPIPDVEVCFTDEFAYQIRPCVVSDEYGYYVQYGFEPYSLTKSYVYIVPSGPEFYFSPFRKKVKVINADIKVNFRAFSPIRQLGGE